MKRVFIFLFIFSLAEIVFFISCKKELSCEGCRDGNKLPLANAGPDQVITLPTDSVSLDGAGSNDPDGTISEWLWTKISGPASFTIDSATSAKSFANNLVTGAYQFELKITDDGGLSSKDTVQVVVKDPTQPNRPPIANAGADHTINLPTNEVTLDGSGSTDPDNNIKSFAWIKISGPVSFNFINANAVQAEVNNLVEGIYQIELKVTDSAGLFSKDTVQVVVNSQMLACDNDNRPLVYAQLIPVGSLSVARNGITGASANNKILFAGGYMQGNMAVSRVDIYDLATKNWSTAELSIARWNMTTAVVGNKVLFIGGWTQDSLTGRVDIYDTYSDTWSMMELNESWGYISASVLGDKVFFTGTRSEWEIPALSIVRIYDLSDDKWTTATLSRGRSCITATSVNNKIFFAGGFSLNGANIDPSAAIDVYDDATNTWSVSSLSEPKVFMYSIFKNGKIYWAGGLSAWNHVDNEGVTSCTVEIRDADTQKSTVANLSHPKEGNSEVVAEMNYKIAFLRQGNDFDIYNLLSNTWSIGMLPQNKWIEQSTVSVNNTVYVAGGDFANGAWSTLVWRVEF